ncbi:MAG: hypothetical protein CL946_10165 [Ectothiorhodospiraceae bacterium]|nr:hypothetical protein [Ectothiorhodospiraceae bacterium]
MRTSIKHFTLTTLLLCMVLSSCSDDEPTDPGNGNDVIVVIEHIPATVKTGENVRFLTTYSGTALNDARYEYDFGDGTEPQWRKPSDDQSHIYSDPGTYTVKVNIWDNISKELHGSGTLEVTVMPFDAAFTLEVDPSSPFIDQQVRFTARNMGDSIALRRYKWDFGDGTTETRKNFNDAVHTYDSNGVYTVSVEVYDDVSNTLRYKDSVDVTVSIYPRPDKADYMAITIQGKFEVHKVFWNHDRTMIIKDTIEVNDTIPASLEQFFTYDDKMTWSGQQLSGDFSQSQSVRGFTVLSNVWLSVDGTKIQKMYLNLQRVGGGLGEHIIDSLLIRAENIPLTGPMKREQAIYKVDGTDYMTAITELKWSQKRTGAGISDHHDFTYIRMLPGSEGLLEITLYKQ